MKRKLAFLLVMMLLGAGSAFAAPTFDLDFYSTTNPANNYVRGVYDTGQTITLATDEVVWIDFYVSGITPESLGLVGYGFNMPWNSAMLSWNGPVTLGDIPQTPFIYAAPMGEIGTDHLNIQAGTAMGLDFPTGDNILLATFSLKCTGQGVSALNFTDWPGQGSVSWLTADGADFGNLLNGQTLGTIQNSAAMPIPAALWLFGSGLLGLLGFRRKVTG